MAVTHCVLSVKDNIHQMSQTSLNEWYSVYSLFRKGNAELYSDLRELSDKTRKHIHTDGQCSNLCFAPALKEPLRNNQVFMYSLHSAVYEEYVPISIGVPLQNPEV